MRVENTIDLQHRIKLKINRLWVEDCFFPHLQLINPQEERRRSLSASLLAGIYAFKACKIMKTHIMITCVSQDNKPWIDFNSQSQGHPTIRFGEYLFGRPKIAWDIRI